VAESRLDALATWAHYADHLLPAWIASGSRGTFWCGDEGIQARVLTAAPEIDARILDRTTQFRGAVLIGSGRDHAIARRRGARAVALMEHGAGQSYAGDPRTARHGAYAGGDGRDGAGLILAPNVYAERRWAARYPAAAVHVVGATRILTPPEDPRSPLLAISFHWSGAIPEMRSALQHYRGALREIGEALPVIGHGHPRAAPLLRRIFEGAGIEFVQDLADVARRATVYAVDNSSTLWEMGLARPVVAINAPWYRRRISHGMRFWDLAGLMADDPGSLVAAAGRLLSGGETAEERMERERVCRAVWPVLDGAARAGRLLREWTSPRRLAP
jgi:hypothetical protein